MSYFFGGSSSETPKPDLEQSRPVDSGAGSDGVPNDLQAID